MTHVPREGAFAPEQSSPDTASPDTVVIAGGVSLSLARDAGATYLLVGSTVPGDSLTLLLPAVAPATATAGLSVFNRLGRLHARYWALVWGQGAPPATGVVFSSGDLRFRRETRSAAVAVGPAWCAVAEGVFREATVDPDGCAPRWLPLAQSR